MKPNLDLNDTQMRHAVAARDASLDGRFVYAEPAIGLFCRPTCLLEPTQEQTLRFFGDARSAMAAGFRPCPRCKPNIAGQSIDRWTELAHYIETHADTKITLASLAKRQGLSPAHLQKAFKAVFGVSPKAYQAAFRLKKLKQLLKAGEDVTGAIFEAGYGSTSRVYGNAANHIGMTPSAYRAGGAGESIVFACRNSCLGPLMMAATARGVCFAMFGDGPETLKKQLEEEFPQADLQPSPASSNLPLDDWMDALDRYLIHGAPRPEVPVEMRGTAFQIKVWRFLQSIPEGAVVSYGEVAKGIGKPRAVRAAASACAKNRVAILIPCHRVLRGDGSLGGYRWGTARKRALLDKEEALRAEL